MARKHFGNFASIFVKDRFQAVNNINDLFSFLWVFNSLNKDNIKNQATTLAEIDSNQLSLEIVDEMLLLKDTYIVCSEFQTFSFSKGYFSRNVRKVSYQFVSKHFNRIENFPYSSHVSCRGRTHIFSSKTS